MVLATYLRHALFASLFLASFNGASAQAPRNVLPPAGITETATLNQNWTDSDAEKFYSIPQGSKLIPYKWYFALEQKGNPTPFRDAVNIQKLGYLPRTPGPSNLDGLPVGFTKDADHLGFMCAACQTQQIVYKAKAYLLIRA